MWAHSSTQIPSVVIDFPSAAEFSNLWGRDAPHAPPVIYVPMLRPWHILEHARPLKTKSRAYSTEKQWRGVVAYSLKSHNYNNINSNDGELLHLSINNMLQLL